MKYRLRFEEEKMAFIALLLIMWNAFMTICVVLTVLVAIGLIGLYKNRYIPYRDKYREVTGKNVSYWRYLNDWYKSIVRDL